MHPHPLTVRILAFLGIRPKCCRQAHRRTERWLDRKLTRREFESFEYAWRNRWQDGRAFGILLQDGLATAGPPVPPDQLWEVEPGHRLVSLDEVAPNVWNYGTVSTVTGERDASIALRMAALTDAEFRRLSGTQSDVDAS